MCFIAVAMLAGLPSWIQISRVCNGSDRQYRFIVDPACRMATLAKQSWKPSLKLHYFILSMIKALRTVSDLPSSSWFPDRLT